MGSENNMVAVPVEPTRAMYDAAYAAFGSSWPNFKSMYAEILRAARLAQPDAQQGASSPASGEGVEWGQPLATAQIDERGQLTATPLAAAATQPAVPQEEWQPIETAPRDGTMLLIANAEGQMAFAAWTDAGDGTWDSGDDYCDWPTHWKLQPEYPALTGAGENGEQGA